MSEPGDPTAAACRRVLVDCLGVRAGEDVLAIADPPQRGLGRALTEEARLLEAEATLIEMAERPAHGAEPPETVAAAMRAADVVVAPTSKSLSHTEARRAACAEGARIASMPGVTVDILTRVMRADPAAVARRARAVARALSAGKRVHVASPGGTDVAFIVEGRAGIADDGVLTAPGAFGNLPAGEGFVAPLEGRTGGRIVFDGAPPAWGEPVIATVEAGYAVSFEGEVGKRFATLLEPHGRDAFAVAELGIGVNDAARLSGNVIEDEKILGTVHVAFGDNHSFGGTIRVPFHQDLVVLHPRVTIDGKEVLADGRLLL